MELYKVKIISRGASFCQDVTVFGTVEYFCSATEIKYTLDGDECVLKIEQDKITQSRRGEQCIEMTFTEGERTKCFIGAFGNIGEFEAYTHSINLLRGKGGIKLNLVYEANDEKINLSFTALKNDREIK